METTKKEIIQRLYDKGHITFTEALILAESILSSPSSGLQIFESMDEVFDNPTPNPYTWKYDEGKTNIT